MENSDQTIDTEDQKTPRRKWAAGRLADAGFFTRWNQDRLSDKSEKNEDEEDDDDQETPSEKLFKRLKRIGSGLLNTFSEKGEKPEAGRLTGVGETKTSDHEEQDIPESESETNSEAELELESEIEPAIGDGTTVESDIATEETAITELSDAEEDTGETREIPAAVEASEPGTKEVEDEEEEPEPTTPTPITPPLVPLSSGAAERGAIHHTEETETVIHERIIERGNGRLAAVALLATGSEYLGRRRAVKKLEAADGQLRKNNEQLRKKVETIVAEKHQETIKQNAKDKRVEQRLEQRIEQQPAKRPEVKRPASREIQTKERGVEAERSAKNERSAETERPRTEMARLIERVVYQRSPELMTEEEKVGQPVERLYEMRHENKDDDAATVAANAASVGAILASQRSNSTTQGYSSSRIAKSQPSEAELKQAKQQMYKQSAALGVWGAFIIIVLGLAVYLFAR